MSEYISKEEINRVLLNRIDMNNKCLSGARESKHFEEEKYFSALIFEDEQIASLIEELTSADVRENIHGHWIEQIDHEENCRTLICSNCDRPALHDEDSIWKHKFCPHCGADMREPKGEKTKDGIQI